MGKIYIEIRSGLGNQLFQVAYAYAVAEKQKKEIVLCPVYFDPPLKRVIKKILGKDIRAFSLPYILRKKISILSQDKIFALQKNGEKINIVTEEESRTGINEMAEGNWLIKGYWQNPALFNTHKLALKEMIQPVFETSAKYKKVISQIDNSTVGIHIRRGDYLTNKAFGACTIAYYEDAMKALEQKININKIVVFSNDPKWVRDNFKTTRELIVYENSHFKYSDIEEMHLLSKFPYIIISNSTFSWWSAWLSDSQTVICPKNWFKKDELQDNVINLVQDNWLVVNNILELQEK